MNLVGITAERVSDDPASRFVQSLAPVAGQPRRKKLPSSPRLTDRTSTVKVSASPLTGRMALFWDH